MKTKRPQQKSSQKDSSVDPKNKSKNKAKNIQHSISVLYQSSKSSHHPNSPKSNNVMEKYKKYIQFITNHKVHNNSLNVSKDQITIHKKPQPDQHHKHSPLPYSKTRKSAYSKLSQPSSPHSKQFTQRHSFPKTIVNSSRKQNNPNFYFVVKGNNINNNKQKNNHKKSNTHLDLNKPKSLSKGQQSTQNDGQPKKNKNIIHTQKKNPIIRKQPTKKNPNKLLPRQQPLDAKAQKLQKQQQKLFQQLFKGIQFYRDLGKGAHALVRSAVDWNHKRKIAVKIYDKLQLSQKQLKSIQRQVQILMSLNHPNIIKLYQIIQTYKTINLIMEYGGGNSLDQYIKSKQQGYLNQQQTKVIFMQVLNAVKYLHEMNVTHRDIKSQNILLNKHLNLKIIDFGFSLIVDQNNKNINTYYGTPTYMAPQMVSKTPHNPQLADRWSLGVLLFAMLNGHCPFRAATQKQLFLKITKGQYEYTKTINPLAKDMISKFMIKNPHQRLSPKQALEHAWLQNQQPTE